MHRCSLRPPTVAGIVPVAGRPARRAGRAATHRGRAAAAGLTHQVEAAAGAEAVRRPAGRGAAAAEYAELAERQVERAEHTERMLLLV